MAQSERPTHKASRPKHDDPKKETETSFRVPKLIQMTKQLIQMAKLKRVRRTRSVEEEEDQSTTTFPIEELPEEILSYLLSFLPLKEAAATSAVCSKWRYSWTHHPRTRLDFDFTSHAKTKNFSIVRTTDRSIRFYPEFEEIEKRTPDYIELVDRLMSSHRRGNGSNNLDEFSISLPLNPDVYGGVIDRWLMCALSSGVERLKFDFTRYMLDSCYYTLPAEFCSSSLKSLCFKSARIEGEALERLLVSSACPSLESIVLKDNFLCSKLKLCLGSLPRLKHLELWDCHSLDSLQVLDSPSLVSFKLKPVAALEHCFLDKLPKLAQVSVAMGRVEGKLEYMKPFSGVFSQLKRLEIDGNTVATYPEVVAPFFGELTKLEELEITVEECENMDLLPYAVLAGKAPRLKKLVMRVLYPGWYRNKVLNSSPTIRRSSSRRPSFVDLKVLEFHGYYYRRDGDNAFIRYLVENAASLKSVVIDPSYQPADERGRCVVKTWDGKDVIMSSREWKGYEQGKICAAEEFSRRLPAQVNLVIA